MQRQNKLRIPSQYLILDTIGSVMVGLGVYGLVVNEIPPELASLNLKRDAWEFIIGGLILMVPMVVYVLHKARARNLGDNE